MYRNTITWFCTIDEIINKQSVLHFKIDKTVFDFFINNIEYCFLHDENNQKIEIPSVAYAICKESKLKFTYIFGIPKQIDKYGNNYYFRNYAYCVTHCKESNEKISEGEEGEGIVRFVLFLGKTLYVGDDVEIEYDWVNKYDSIFIIGENNRIINKDYNQQCTLSYHYVKSNQIK